MILARKFTQAEDNDYEHLAAAGGRLRAVLEAFVEGSLPPEYDAEKLAAYAESLIASVLEDGSFSASKNPENLEPDVETDAHRFVTWVAAAFLNRLKMIHPREAAAVKGLQAALDGALASPAASSLRFPESGPAEPVQQVEAVLILASGGIPAYLASRPDLAPGLLAALNDLVREFRERMKSGETSLPGGIDYAPLFEQSLAAMER